MSGEHPDTVRVETSIWRRPGGTYAVAMMRDYVTYRKSFKTLAEARRFREMIRNKKPDLIGDTRLEIRAARKNAETIVRDGREFKLVRL